MKKKPAVWMLVLVFEGNVALICITDDMSEIRHYSELMPPSDSQWDRKLVAHDKGISPDAAAEFRKMAIQGVPFVGRHAHMLGIATDWEGPSH